MTGTPTWTTSATQFSNVGEDEITGSGFVAVNGNYSFDQASKNSTAFTINQRSLNFTGTRMYNGTTLIDASILKLSNIVNGDNVSVSGSANIAELENNKGGVGIYSTFVTNNLNSSNLNYSVEGGTVRIEITPQTANPVGDAYYTGPGFYWTTGTNSSTATLTLAATIKNNPNYTGDIRTSKVSFFIKNANGTLTPITGAQNLPVDVVNPGDLSVGSAATNVQYNIGSSTVATLNIAVRITGNYNSMNEPDYDGMITVAVPTPGGLIVGGGKLCQENSSGFIKGAKDRRSDISFNVKYNKSLENPQGGVEITIKSYYDRNGNLGTNLRIYKVRSNAINTLAVNSPNADFTSKGNILEVVNGVEQSIEGNLTLQLKLHDKNAPNPAFSTDKIAVTVYRSKGGIWYSNNWDGTKSILTDLCREGDDISVTGSGTTVTSTNTASVQQVTARPQQVDVAPTTAFNLTAFPNPTASHFNVKLESSNNTEKIVVRVIDLQGRTVEVFNNLVPGQTLQIGSNYRTGVYFVEMIQGTNRKQLQLIKRIH